MPVSVLGWWRTGLPSRPSQDRRRASGNARNKLAAPPAGAANPQPAEPPPPAPERSPEEEGSDAQEASAGHAVEKAASPSAGRALGVAAVLSGARNWGFLLHAVGVHTANLAASLAARPLAPLQARLQTQLAGTEAVQTACRQLGVDSLSELQDLMNCVLLSEHVYKIVDHTTEVSVSLINDVKAQFPPHLTTLRTVQWAQPHVRHRYLLGESDDAVYVSFMGTKLARDMATNANLFQEEVVLDAAMLSSGPSAEVGEGSAGAAVAGGRTLAAHRGFLARAGSIPVHQLYQEARARGKRLVLCGHSLGGAVASLCAIRLLQHLPPNLHHTVSVYGFATPALGNEALQAAVQEMGWHTRIRNYISPDDPIPKLLSFRRPPAEKAADKVATAEGSPRSSSAPDMPASGVGAALAASAPAAAGPAAAAPPSTAGAAPAAAAVLPGANNIQSAPRLSSGLATIGAQQRLGRIASHVAAGSRQAEAGLEAEEQAQSRVLLQAPLPMALAGAGLPRSRSAPAQLSDSAVNSVEEHAAAVAAAHGSSDEARGATHGNGDALPVGPQHWLGQRLAEAAAPPLRRAGSAALAAAAPPMRAVVERAGSAARLVALPLSAAASVPMRAAPAYLPLGKQLYILPALVSSTEPAPGQAAAAPAAAPAAPQRRWPALWRLQPAAASGGGGSQDDDVEDNVDVAAAASLSASLDGAEGSAAAQQQQQARRRGMFYSHRMATYRSRLLGICQGALEGHLMVRSLPTLPTLPRPGDVVASELLAPPMFPLRAVATLAPSEGHAGRRGAAPAPMQGDGQVHAAAAQAPAAPMGQQQQQHQQQQKDRRRGFQPLAFWSRLLARAAGEQRRRQEAPLELLIRVEGRGLANVTAAWIEGIPPVNPAEGGQAPAASSQDGGDRAVMPAPAPPAAEVRILEQPAAQALPPPLSGRPPLPVVGQLSAFVSWVAATLGWVALLRQLQPAGRSDYLLARVRLPAAAVRDVQRATESSLLTSVTDGPLLQGLSPGPRLSLRLQSDFASHTVPLDIRMGADLSAQQAQRWQWPWHRQQGAASPAKVHPLRQQRMRQRARQLQQPASTQAQRQRQQGRWWWEWPGDTAASGH